MNTFRQTFILVALTVVFTGLIVSACAFWGAQRPSETEMEATVVALVDTRLTEAANAACLIPEPHRAGTRLVTG